MSLCKRLTFQAFLVAHGRWDPFPPGAYEEKPSAFLNRRLLNEEEDPRAAVLSPKWKFLFFCSKDILNSHVRIISQPKTLNGSQ